MTRWPFNPNTYRRVCFQVQSVHRDNRFPILKNLKSGLHISASRVIPTSNHSSSEKLGWLSLRRGHYRRRPQTIQDSTIQSKTMRASETFLNSLRFHRYRHCVSHHSLLSFFLFFFQFFELTTFLQFLLENTLWFRFLFGLYPLLLFSYIFDTNPFFIRFIWYAWQTQIDFRSLFRTIVCFLTNTT